MNNKLTGNKMSVQWWKIAGCVLGVLMIAGAVTYTLITRAAASSIGPTVNPTASVASNAQSSDGIGELNWVTSIRTKYSKANFIFIVFPGNSDVTAKVEQIVRSALDKIRQDGSVVESITLPASDPEFSVTMERLAIQKLPVVLLMASTGQGAIIKGDINETKVLQAYLTLVKTCVPGSGSSCCP